MNTSNVLNGAKGKMISNMQNTNQQKSLQRIKQKYAAILQE